MPNFTAFWLALAENAYLSELYADLSFGNMHFQLVRNYPAEIIGVGFAGRTA